MKDFKNDKFKKYRSLQAKAVVGIAMKLIYIAETRPKIRETGSEHEDQKIVVHYLYELELDKDGMIIGGEWYHNHHPDFMWTPAPVVKPVSIGDAYLCSSKKQVIRQIGKMETIILFLRLGDMQR